jgi:hypothetical protein
MLSSSGLREEGVEGIITASHRLIAGHLAIRLQKEQEHHNTLKKQKSTSQK